MSDWKTRLLEERDELNHRLMKLERFMQSDEFKNIEKEQKALLNVQLDAMISYYQCLDQRIKMLED